MAGNSQELVKVSQVNDRARRELIVPVLVAILFRYVVMCLAIKEARHMDETLKALYDSFYTPPRWRD